MTYAEEQDLKDLAYWEELTRALGWRLMGFTYRRRALIEVVPNDVVGISGQMRDSIVNKLKGG